MERKQQHAVIKSTTERSQVVGVGRGAFELARAFVVTTVVGTSLLAVGCASDAEPENNESNIESVNDPGQVFKKFGGGDGINGTAKSRSNTCKITQGSYLTKNKLYVKCIQSGGGICNGTLTIPLSERGQLELQVQNFNPGVSIEKNQGWAPQDGITCVNGSAKLQVTMDASRENVKAISLNGTAYTFVAN